MSDAARATQHSRARRARWTPPVAWAVLLLTATSVPNPALPNVGGLDKVVHAGMYGVLAWLVCRALGAGGHRAPAFVGARVVVAAALFGAVDEWHQKLIPGRSCDVADWAADTTGAAAAVTTFATIRRLTRRAAA